MHLPDVLQNLTEAAPRASANCEYWLLRQCALRQSLLALQVLDAFLQFDNLPFIHLKRRNDAAVPWASVWLWSAVFSLRSAT